MDRRTPSQPGVQAVKIPYKIVRGTCTLSVALLKDAGYIPYGPDGEEDLPRSDLSTWEALMRLASDILLGCIRAKGWMGWAPAGQQAGLGVFFWETGSGKDREVKSISRIPLIQQGNSSDELTSAAADLSIA
ncbi:MAG: hypothetical protein Q9174_005387 [Haloplaca sp. 1 TL-2023]